MTRVRKVIAAATLTTLLFVAWVACPPPTAVAPHDTVFLDPEPPEVTRRAVTAPYVVVGDRGAAPPPSPPPPLPDIDPETGKAMTERGGVDQITSLFLERTPQSVLDNALLAPSWWDADRALEHAKERIEAARDACGCEAHGDYQLLCDTYPCYAYFTTDRVSGYRDTHIDVRCVNQCGNEHTNFPSGMVYYTPSELGHSRRKQHFEALLDDRDVDWFKVQAERHDHFRGHYPYDNAALRMREAWGLDSLSEPASP